MSVSNNSKIKTKSNKMTKIFLTLSAMLIAVAVSAQDRYTAYAELLGYQKGLFSRKVKVSVDFGQDVSFWKSSSDMKIVSEDGKDIVFNSMVDAMNFMGKCGWKFEQAYVVTEGNQNVYHWLLSKEVSSETEIQEGFKVKADFSGIKENSYVITYYRKLKTQTAWDEVRTETLKGVSPEEVLTITNDWKNQESDRYDYDCRVAKK